MWQIEDYQKKKKKEDLWHEAYSVVMERLVESDEFKKKIGLTIILNRLLQSRYSFEGYTCILMGNLLWNGKSVWFDKSDGSSAEIELRQKKDITCYTFFLLDCQDRKK